MLVTCKSEKISENSQESVVLQDYIPTLHRPSGIPYMELLSRLGSILVAARAGDEETSTELQRD